MVEIRRWSGNTDGRSWIIITGRGLPSLVVEYRRRSWVTATGGLPMVGRDLPPLIVDYRHGSWIPAISRTLPIIGRGLTPMIVYRRLSWITAVVVDYHLLVLDYRRLMCCLACPPLLPLVLCLL